MRQIQEQDGKNWCALALGVLGLVACSGNVDAGDPGGSGGTGGNGGTGGAGGAAEPGLYDAFCEAQATCKADGGQEYDAAACKASAQCDSRLLHHPGGPLFECLGQACSVTACLPDVYISYSSSEPTSAALDFEDRCKSALEQGCGVFEDFCFAGALFADEALAEMTECFDLPTCDETKSCALETYSFCLGWLYQPPP